MHLKHQEWVAQIKRYTHKSLYTSDERGDERREREQERQSTYVWLCVWSVNKTTNWSTKITFTAVLELLIDAFKLMRNGLLLPLLLNTLITLCWLTAQRIPPILLSFVSPLNVRPPYQFIIEFTSNGMAMAMMMIIICSMLLLLLLFCQQLRTWCFFLYRHTPTHTRDNIQHRFSALSVRFTVLILLFVSSSLLCDCYTLTQWLQYSSILFGFVLFSFFLCVVVVVVVNVVCTLESR